jgi:hypothetical protein
MGVPISAMTPTNTLNNTDKFVISQGPVLGDNKSITYSALLALITSAVQNFGQSLSSVQTAGYTNNNIAADVIPSLNIVLTQGKWDIFFDASVAGSATPDDFSYYISYNTNPLIVNQDPSDISLNGSVRDTRLPSNSSVSASSMGSSLIVPAGNSYIVKIACYNAGGNNYTVNNRVLKAIKTL